MKLNTFLVAVTVLFLTVSCGTTNQKTSFPTPKKVNKKPIGYYTFKKDSSKIYFNIVQMNDVYEIAPIQGGKFGGLARVQTIKNEVSKETPNTLMVLAGDFLNPSLLGTLKVDGERIRGKQMVDVLNTMNIDAVCFGNHEFDLSYEHLQERLNESNFPWISANIMHKKDHKLFYFNKVVNGHKIPLEETFITEFNELDGSKLKIGFISVCLPSNPRNYVHYGDIYEEIKRSYNEIKDRVDIVIGLTHLEIGQDRKVAQLLPDLPLIMGGHEHTNNYEQVGTTKIAKADANAKSIYIHRFEVDKLTKAVRIKSELRHVTDEVEPNPEVKKAVDKWQAILNTKIKEVIENPNEVIYNAKNPLNGLDTPSRSTQTNLGGIIAKAMSFAYKNKVDCALVNGGSIRIDDELKGSITAVDIFRVLPYGGEVLKVKIKGSLLEEVLNYGEQSAGTGAYLQRYNAKKVGGVWFVKDKQIDTNKTYTVAFSDYLLKGFDIPFLKSSNPKVISIYKPLNSSELGFDIRKSVIEYLRNK